MSEIQELIEWLRWYATDWDGTQMDDREPAKGCPTAGDLRSVADHLERMHKALEEIAANDSEGFDASIARSALNRG